jgi:Flp pilus assembly protein TadB
MAVLGYSFAFLVLLGVVAWIVFPRLMRVLFIAVAAFVGVAWLMGSLPDKTTAQHQERPR